MLETVRNAERWDAEVRRDVVPRFVAAATSPSDRIVLRRTVGGCGETSGSRRGRDGTAAAALGPRPTRPTPNTLSVQKRVTLYFTYMPHKGTGIQIISHTH